MIIPPLWCLQKEGLTITIIMIMMMIMIVMMIVMMIVITVVGGKLQQLGWEGCIGLSRCHLGRKRWMGSVGGMAAE